ncbi:multidrug ABC transporter ATP-binding protein [Parapedobacter defluvii]|uniref:Multidrug ABC transporter ATP-binding protein n=1 Tax=Parapedobacter defluvii TaxID=2045106 RepID=A0ABQ1M1D2_9SPHI|nr:ABC transporter ATP-binding protein [Parapedobacter defluvii]GGC33328.1 multidrug ABC transporter ATP-binding protein [Parapedobacter defluvii]
MATHQIVEIKNLSHRYATAWAIRDINFEINKKGIYGLLGSNGAGKSTTMNILCGVLNQTEGSVYINGINTNESPIDAKRQIGFLPQVAPLYLDLTTYEYLLYCARLRDIKEAAIPPSLEEVMEKCGIVHVRNRLLKNLSGGYRQRVGIAQAIVHKPKVVILDEPTNGLDPVQIVEVRNLIKEIAQDRTVILSSHILSEIQVLCEDIIMIEQGRLVFSDSMEAFNNYIAPQSLLVEFENAPDLESVAAIKGINRVEQLGIKSYRVFFDGDKSVCEGIVKESVGKGWRLTELTVEKNSVDEIFRQLTKNTANN